MRTSSRRRGPSFLLFLCAAGAAIEAQGAAGEEHPQEETASEESATDLSKERRLVAEAREKLGALGYAAAREKASEAVRSLLARPESERNAGWVSLLHEAGTVAWRAEDVEAARLAWERVLEIRSRTLPDDHDDLQYARQDVALTMRAQGHLRAALSLEEKAVEVFTRTKPDDAPEFQRLRESLAATRLELGDLEGAKLLFEKILEVRSRTLDEDHIDIQMARQNLAVVKKALGDLPGARALQEEALAVLTRTLPEDSLRIQDVRQNLAVTMKAMGDAAGARPLEEKVLAVRARLLPEDHPDLLAARQTLAGTLFALGDLASARDLFARVLAVWERTLAGDHPDLQVARLNLATTIKALGDLRGARVLQESVLEVFSRSLLDDHPRLQAARQNLASTLKEMGDLAGARALEAKVLEIRSRTLPPNHPDRITARQNLAVTFRLQGDLARARELESEALEALLSSGHSEEHPVVLMVKQNLAVTSAALGDLARAREFDESVLAARERTLPSDHPDLRAARANLLLTMAEERRGEEDAARFASIAAEFARSLAALSPEVLLAESSREAEERCGELAPDLGLALSFASGFGVFGADAALDAEAFLASEAIRSAAIASARLTRSAGSHPRYADLRERMLAASEFLAIAARGGAPAEEMEEARRERESAERELMTIARGAAATREFGARPGLAEYARRLSAGDAIVGLRRYDRSSAAPVKGLSSWTIESLCAFVLRSGGQLTRVELGPAAAIEEAVREWRRAIGAGVERGAASPDDARGSREPRSDAPALRGADLEAEETAGPSRQRGEELRRLVFDPLRPALRDATRVIVALDDVLHLVPLDALPMSEPDRGPSVGDVFRIETRGTLAEILWNREPYAGAAALVALGGASFDAEAVALGAADSPDEPVARSSAPSRPLEGPVALRGGPWAGGFGSLAHTGLEARAIVALHDGAFGESGAARVLEKRKASREALTALAPTARFLHVATHGWFAPESIRSSGDSEPLDARSGLGRRMSGEERVRGMSPMLLCGLALAGANLPEDASGRAPGLITAEEIATLDLRNCELAVLSACDTNVGERRAGQGVASLQKALHMAGARSVVTSLWKVPDEATKTLMLDFYRRLWTEKKPKAQALWEAKKKLRDEKDERGEPRYSVRDWAGWVLTGEPD